MSDGITFPGEPDDELLRLVDGLIDGGLSIEQQRHLEERLGREPESAEYCAARMRFEGELNECLNPTRFELVQSRRFVVEGKGKNRRVMIKQTQEALIGRRGSALSLPERAGGRSPGRKGLLLSASLLLLVAVLGIGWLATTRLQNGTTGETAAGRVPDPGRGLWQRQPANDAELRYWLQNMVYFHGYETHEISAATGMNESQILSALERFGFEGESRPDREAGSLLTLPYPGGRHPRTGNLEQAINPQRDTKVSVFAPWQDGGYVVLDLPEALSISETYFYLAHADETTIWERQNIVLPSLEWIRKDGGQLESRRKLPNGVEFAVDVRPEEDSVRLKFTLHNGSGGPLKRIKIQNCVMVGRAKGFEESGEDSRFAFGPYMACRSQNLTRWIIICWEHPERLWGISECPCIHCDPYLPVCQRGETMALNGWLSFYEGLDIAGEIDRIEATGWRKN